MPVTAVVLGAPRSVDDGGRFGRHPWHHDPIVVVAEDPNVLIERVQRGDHTAFGALYDAIAPQVYGVVRRVLRDPAMSEEVTQEVFVELWKTAGRFDPSRASVSTWAITIARRRAIDRVRSEQARRTRVEVVARREVPPDTDPHGEVVASLDAERVNRALAELPDDQRTVIRLAFIDGHAHGAIAEMLDLPLGTVKGRVRGGLRRLRTIMDDHA